VPVPVPVPVLPVPVPVLPVPVPVLPVPVPVLPVVDPLGAPMVTVCPVDPEVVVVVVPPLLVVVVVVPPVVFVTGHETDLAWMTTPAPKLHVLDVFGVVFGVVVLGVVWWMTTLWVVAPGVWVITICWPLIGTPPI
jgi:NhaP-type Na+/H+ or K+/H+ antiporter